MRGAIDFFKRGIQRVNARIAILVVVVAAGGVAAWQGFSHMARNQPQPGPKKEIATGISPADTGSSSAATTLPATHPPAAAGAGEHRLIGYGQPDNSAAMPSTAPPTSPYLPQSGDPASGYGGGFATLQPPATSPPATSPPERASASSISDEQIPENQYRTGSAASSSNPPATSPPLTESPYAGPATVNSEGAAPAADSTATNDLNPAASSGGSYGDYGRDAAPNTYSPNYSPPAALPAASVPPNPLPPADLSASPYGQPRNAIGSSISRSEPPAPLAAKLATATPGERQLEGPQQPAISVEKVSPAEIQVGKQATFELYVRNTGQVAAHQVVITDHVPAGTQLVDARPQPQQGADGSLVWSLGTVQPGEETQITLQVMPQTEGEIGSTAQVSFAAAATSRSICTRPQLTIEHAAVPKVLIGESFNVEITISNPGSGPATGVRIEEDVPAGLAHAAGAQLEYEVGTLRPGESKRLALVLTAKQAGQLQNVIHAKGDGGLAAQHAIGLEVVAPQLTVDVVDGPKRRTLERQATYTLQIANPGTAAARDVELVAFLPRGMKFVATDAQGQYDAAQHAVFWSLEELPPAKAGAVKLTTLPVEPGEQRLRVEGRADLGLTAASEQLVQVEQSAEVVFTVKDVDEVIEVGSETTYEIRVTNTGTKAATNVRIAAQLPPGMAAMNGEGPTRAGGDASQITFEPLARLNPQEEVIYKVQVQGKQPGDHKISVQLASDEWPTPVIREESTRVYLDR